MRGSAQLVNPDTGTVLTIATTAALGGYWQEDLINSAWFTNPTLMLSWRFSMATLSGYPVGYTQIRPALGLFFSPGGSGQDMSTISALTSFVSGSTIAYYRSDYWSNS